MFCSFSPFWHLRYPTIDAKKIGFADVVGKGMSPQRKLLKQTQHLRGHFVTYSPQSASSALNPGRTIGRQMEMAIARRDTPPASLSQEILRILAQVGLDRASVGALPSELSGYVSACRVGNSHCAQSTIGDCR